MSLSVMIVASQPKISLVDTAFSGHCALNKFGPLFSCTGYS